MASLYEQLTGVTSAVDSFYFLLKEIEIQDKTKSKDKVEVLLLQIKTLESEIKDTDTQVRRLP